MEILETPFYQEFYGDLYFLQEFSCKKKSPVILYPFQILTEIVYMKTKSCFSLMMQHCMSLLKCAH